MSRYGKDVSKLVVASGVHNASLSASHLCGTFVDISNRATATGSLLLAHFIQCLATLVELSGPQASQVLSCDLLDLVWRLRTAEVVEVRLSVLTAVGTALALLPEQQLLTVLIRDDLELPKAVAQLSIDDPNDKCRELSQHISSNVYEILSAGSLSN